MIALPGASQLGDDESVEFEDFVGSVVTILVPGAADDATAPEFAAFAAARAGTDERVLFFVAPGRRRCSTASPTPAARRRSGSVRSIVRGRGSSADFPDGSDALVVVDRAGTVAAVFVGAMPGRDELVEF